MALTPVELRHVKLGKGLWGYRQSLDRPAARGDRRSFEDVWRERADLEDKLERLESDIPAIVTSRLSSERRSSPRSEAPRSSRIRPAARRTCVLTEAHAEARLIKQRALVEREHLRGEASRIRSLLRSALAMVEGDNGEDEAAEAA